MNTIATIAAAFLQLFLITINNANKDIIRSQNEILGPTCDLPINVILFESEGSCFSRRFRFRLRTFVWSKIAKILSAKWTPYCWNRNEI